MATGAHFADCVYRRDMRDRSMSSVKIVEWYLRRPSMWGELGRGVSQRLRRGSPDELAAATLRCQELAVPRSEVFDRLSISAVDVTELDPYSDARRRLADRGIRVAGAADTAVLYSACLAYRPTAVLETGVAHGLSSLAVLLAMDANASGHLTSVDMPYRGSTDDSYVGQAVPTELRDRWTLIRKPDRRGLPRAIAQQHQPFDIVHYDSDKTRSGRMFAYPRMWEATRPGGLFFSDDVNDNGAFIEFAGRVGVEPLIWERPGGDSFVGVLRRPG